jgi:hypothetical protein
LMSLRGMMGVRTFSNFHRTPINTPNLGVRCWTSPNSVGQTISINPL